MSKASWKNKFFEIDLTKDEIDNAPPLAAKTILSANLDIDETNIAIALEK